MARSLLEAIGSTRKSQLDVLDGVRGLAVLFVLTSHLANEQLILIQGLKLSGDGAGKLGVYLFFCLSAFLLTRGLLLQPSDELRHARLWVDYASRRLLRIYPLYSVVLLFVYFTPDYGAMWGMLFFDDHQLLRHLAFIGGRQHLWTIGVEVRFYLILPLLILAASSIFRRNMIAFSGAMTALAGLASVHLAHSGVVNHLDFEQYLPIFLGGVVAAALDHQLPQLEGRDAIRRLGWIGITLLGLSLLAMPNLFELLTGIKPRILTPVHAPIWGALFGALLFCCVRDRGCLAELFRNQAMRFIGLISFSVYLWHWFVLKWVVSLSTPTPIKLVLFYAILISFSTLTYLSIERPLSRVRLVRVGTGSRFERSGAATREDEEMRGQRPDPS